MTHEELFNAALQLPEDERTAFGEALLGQGEMASDLAEAWTAEINGRLADIDTGRVQLIPAEEAFEQARARLRSARMKRAS